MPKTILPEVGVNPSWHYGKDVQTPTKPEETKIQISKNSTNETKEEGFFSGVAVLTLSSLVVKALGMLFKIPMNYILGDTGMGYYNAAYTIYTFFYMLSTAGLPTAVTILVSEAKERRRDILAQSLWLFCGIGTVGTCILWFGGEAMAKWIGAPPSVTCMYVVAPTLFFICIASALRGYYQGLSRMLPTAISQLLEALGKVAIGMLCALVAIRQGRPTPVVAACAAMGLTVGAACGMVYLLFCLRHDAEKSSTPWQESTTGDLLRRLVHIAVPITISAAVTSLTSMIDAALIQRLLQQNGLSQETATTLYGNYTSLAVPLFNLPPTLVYPIAYAIVPLLTRHVGAPKKIRSLTETALRLSILIGAPCAMGMTVLADPILSLLFRADSATLAAPLLVRLAPSSLFVCVLAVTNAVLQSIGKATLPVFSMLAGAAVKILSTLWLLPRYGITAAPVSTFLCYLIATAMNLVFVLHSTGLSLHLKRTCLCPMLAAGICATAARLTYVGLTALVPSKIAVLVAIGTAAAVYLLCVRRMGILGPEERALLPKKPWVQKLLYSKEK